jgi:hypothetical protein
MRSRDPRFPGDLHDIRGSGRWIGQDGLTLGLQCRTGIQLHLEAAGRAANASTECAPPILEAPQVRVMRRRTATIPWGKRIHFEAVRFTADMDANMGIQNI